MTERPILFSAPMVRAILAGAKSQTRRAVKPQPPADHRFVGWTIESTVCNDEGKAVWAQGDVSALLRDAHRVRCPYGSPGDRLWVRETWAHGTHAMGAERDEDGPFVYAADGTTQGRLGNRWIPSIHMPRWAGRILLEVTSVRIERLQDISEADAIAEGVNVHTDHHGKPPSSIYSPYQAYRELWEQINGAGSWDTNPWVWVVEFERIKP